MIIPGRPDSKNDRRVIPDPNPVNGRFGCIQPQSQRENEMGFVIKGHDGDLVVTVCQGVDQRLGGFLGVLHGLAIVGCVAGARVEIIKWAVTGGRRRHRLGGVQDNHHIQGGGLRDGVGGQRDVREPHQR